MNHPLPPPLETRETGESIIKNRIVISFHTMFQGIILYMFHDINVYKFNFIVREPMNESPSAIHEYA